MFYKAAYRKHKIPVPQCSIQEPPRDGAEQSVGRIVKVFVFFCVLRVRLCLISAWFWKYDIVVVDQEVRDCDECKNSEK